MGLHGFPVSMAGLVGSNHVLQVVVAAESLCDIRTWDDVVSSYRVRLSGGKNMSVFGGELLKVGKVLLIFVSNLMNKNLGENHVLQGFKLNHGVNSPSRALPRGDISDHLRVPMGSRPNM